MNPRYAVAVFDLDGTLTDSEPGIVAAVRLALQATGYPVPDLAGLRAHIGPPLEWGFRELDGMDGATAARARDVFREYYRERGWAENELYPGVRQMLEDLAAAGVTMAVATAKLEELARRIVAHFDLERFFTGTFGPGPGDSSPLKVAQLRRALASARWDGRPHSAVLTGDRSHDFEAAAALGIGSIAAAWGYGTPGEREAATLSARAPEEVSAAILG